MTKHLETGKKGEDTAVSFLQKKGYQILHRNWVFEKDEIDIIARQDETIVFVEVKTRTSLSHGFPEEAVSRSKKIKLLRAIDAYLEISKLDNEIRIDIISVIFNNNSVNILHFEDAVEWLNDLE